MRNALSSALLTLALLGCGGDSSGPGDDDGNGNEPPPEPVDAAVVVVTGSVDRPTQFQQSITLQLRNDGGPGVYKIELWGLPTSPNGPETFMGESEPVEVGEDYEEEVNYDVGTASFAEYVLVFTRNQGSAQYRQTNRFDFPD